MRIWTLYAIKILHNLIICFGNFSCCNLLFHVYAAKVWGSKPQVFGSQPHFLSKKLGVFRSELQFWAKSLEVPGQSSNFWAKSSEVPGQSSNFRPKSSEVSSQSSNFRAKSSEVLDQSSNFWKILVKFLFTETYTNIFSIFTNNYGRKYN